MKNIKGPLLQIPLVPMGGVELNNSADFLRTGACMVAVGGNLISKKLFDDHDYAGTTTNARAFANAVAQV